MTTSTLCLRTCSIRSCCASPVTRKSQRHFNLQRRRMITISTQVQSLANNRQLPCRPTVMAAIAVVVWQQMEKLNNNNSTFLLSNSNNNSHNTKDPPRASFLSTESACLPLHSPIYSTIRYSSISLSAPSTCATAIG